MIEIYLLEQLDAFATYGTLSEAAEKLYMTQPTLSRSMQKLEDYFGFPLFDRDKKRLSLNPAGKLAADYARRILEDERAMERHVKSYNKSLHTLHIGSIAPGPLMVLLPRTTALFPDTTIASSIDTEETVLKGLLSDEYGIIITTRPIDNDALISQKYISEHLNVSLNLMHPAANKKTVSFSEMNGQNFLMFSQVGIWEDIVKSEMPNSLFYKQESFEALAEITKYSELPSFSTDITLAQPNSSSGNRVHIPFSDSSATMTYYLVCKKECLNKYKLLINS